MNKILFMAAVFFGAMGSSNAQNNRYSLSGAPTDQTVQKKNDPMVNGMPYSQWKAQQDALKQQKAQQAAARASAPATDVTAMVKTNAGMTQTKPADKQVQAAAAGNETRNMDQKPAEIAAPATGNKKVALATGAKNATPAAEVIFPAGGNAAGLPANKASAPAVETGTNVPVGYQNGSPAVKSAEKTATTKPAATTPGKN